MAAVAVVASCTDPSDEPLLRRLDVSGVDLERDATPSDASDVEDAGPVDDGSESTADGESAADGALGDATATDGGLDETGEGG